MGSADDLKLALEKVLQNLNDMKPIETKVTYKEYSVYERSKEIKQIIFNKKRVVFNELFKVNSKDYIVGDILRATEGDLAPIICLTEDGVCQRKQICKTYSFWKGLDDVINDYIDSKTLEDLLK